MSMNENIKDGHIHSPYCPHGSKDSFELYIESALKLGLKEITFTEHMTLPNNFLPPKLMNSSSPSANKLNSYIKDLKYLKSKYIKKITINVGLEVDYIEGYEKEITELLNNYGYNLDESILSVHFIKVENDYYRVDLDSHEFAKLIYKLGSIEKVYDKYYETLLKSIQCNLGKFKPTRIGHPTLVRTFRTLYPLTYTNTSILEQIVKEIEKRNYQVDFNTSGFRKPYCKESYPSGYLYELFKVLQCSNDIWIRCPQLVRCRKTELGNKSIDYKINNLNQITKKSEDSWNTQSDFTYDRRGNLIRETNTKNGKVSVTGEYTYDETNKMVLGNVNCGA